MKRLFIVSFFVVLILSGCSAQLFTQNDFLVSPEESIQEAINLAQSGDTILVESGIYEERPRVRYKDNITVTCDVPYACIIRGFDLWGNDGVLDGFVSDGATLSGIEVRHSNNTVRNVEIKNVQIKSDNDGVRVFGPGHVFENLYIHDFPWDERILPHQDCFQTWGDTYRGGVAHNISINHIVCENENNGGNIRAKFINAEHNADNWTIEHSVYVGTYGSLIQESRDWIWENNTFIGKGIDVPMGVRLKENSSGEFRNNIFVGFTWDALRAEDTSSIVASNNCYWENRPRTPDIGDIYANPLLLPNYHLDPASPCGNMGAFPLGQVPPIATSTYTPTPIPSATYTATPSATHTVTQTPTVEPITTTTSTPTITLTQTPIPSVEMDCFPLIPEFDWPLLCYLKK